MNSKRSKGVGTSSPVRRSPPRDAGQPGGFFCEGRKNPLAAVWRAFRRIPDGLLLFLLTVLLFIPSLRGGFVYDSEPQILHCDFLHNPAHLADIVTLRVVRMDIIDRVRPVQLLSLMADAAIWGKNPFGYHLTSLLVHALNTTLLFLLLLRICAPDRPFRRPAAWLGALLFAVHPALVEAVTEVSFREDLLATAGLLGGLLAMAAAARRTGWRRVAGACGALWLLLLAAGAKETGWIGPLLLAASCPVLAQKKDRRLVGIVSLLAALLIAAFVFHSHRVAPADSSIFLFAPAYPDPSLPGMLKLLPRFWLFQLQQIFFPYVLSADYGPFSIRHLPAIAAGPIILLLAIGAAVVALRVKPLRFGLFVFICAMLPTSNLLPLFRPLADRYLYLPMTGLSLTLAAWLPLLPWRPQRAVALFLAVLVAVWIPLNMQRQMIWGDPLRLWSDTLEKNPYSITASNNLGYANLTRGRFEDALDAWSQTLSIAPEYANAWAGAALAFEALDLSQNADAALLRSIEIDPLYSNPSALRASMRMSPEQIDQLVPLLQRNGLLPRAETGVKKGSANEF